MCVCLLAHISAVCACECVCVQVRVHVYAQVCVGVFTNKVCEGERALDCPYVGRIMKYPHAA